MLYKHVNGSVVCPTCRQILRILGDKERFVEGYKTSSGKIFCSEFCAEDEPPTYLTPRGLQ